MSDYAVGITPRQRSLSKSTRGKDDGEKGDTFRSGAEDGSYMTYERDTQEEATSVRPDRKAFGRWVKRNRTAHGWTQRELGEHAHYAENTIKKLEGGRIHPSDTLVASLLRVFTVVPGSTEEQEVLALLRPAPQIAVPIEEATQIVSSSVDVTIPVDDREPVIHINIVKRVLQWLLDLRTLLALQDHDYRSMRNRQRMIEKVHAFWIRDVLDNSLYGATLLTLGLEQRVDAVLHPWGMVLQRSEQESQKLPADTTISQVFDDLSGTLLILGEPGSGKTTTLLTLTRDLLARARQDATFPLPVVFNLSSWSPRRPSIARWLVDELASKYYVPRSLGQQWVDDGDLLPLLDGLDELPSAYRANCVAALNSFRRTHGLGHMVVCSRLADYVEIHAKLALQGAVVVQPLSMEQIELYLARAGAVVANLHDAIQRDTALQELAHSPLMLNIMALAYHRRSLYLPTSLTQDERRKQIFATYVERMLHRRGMIYPPAQTQQCLGWLAHMLLRYEHTIFLIEHMQPSWLLSLNQRWLYTYGEVAGVGLIVGVGTSIAYGLRTVLPDANLQGPFHTLLSMTWYLQWFEQGLVGGTCAIILWLCVLVLIGSGIGGLAGSVTGITARLIETILMLWQIPERGVWQRLNAFLIITTSVSLAVGGTASLFVGAKLGAVDGVSTGCIAGAATLMLARPGVIVSVETLGWSWMKAVRGLIVALPIVLLVSVIAITTGAFNPAVFYRLDARVLIYGFGLWVAAGVTANTIPKRTSVNQGLYYSARNALKVALGTWLFLGVLGEGLRLVFDTLNGADTMSPIQHIVSMLEFGLAGAIVTGLGFGGFVCLQQTILRLILARAHIIPWHYTRFLDYAVSCIFLRKVGGGYIFVHRLLLEYFASLDHDPQV